MNQLASSLLTATGDLTSTLGNTLGNILQGGSKKGVQPNQLQGGTNKQSDKKSPITSNKGRGGILGTGIL